MNLAWFRLALAGLWLIPAVGFFVLEWSTGELVALPIGDRRLPLAWLFLLFGIYNLMRWWATPPTPPRSRPSSRPPPNKPIDPNFQFDDDTAPTAPPS
jgi:hypothetical protein